MKKYNKTTIVSGGVNAYHGTNNVFANFDYSYIGSNEGIDGAGYGFYFTEDRKEAGQYGKIIRQHTLILKNQLFNDKVTLTETKLRDVLADLSYTLKLPQPTRYVINKCLSLKSDTAIIKHIWENIIVINLESMFSIEKSFEHFMDILYLNGFTHTIDNKTPNDKNILHYIIYNVKSIL